MKSLSLLLAASVALQAITPPGNEYDNSERATSFMKSGRSDLEGNLSYDMMRESITVLWRHTFDVATWEPTYYSRQVEPLAYWPTEAASLPGFYVAVAGKNQRTGNTVIEMLLFDTQAKLVRPYTDSSTGETVYPQLDVPIKSRKLILDEDKDGRRLVKEMVPLLGGNLALLLYYGDSKNLCALNATGGNTPVVLWSPDPNSGHPHCPALSRDFEGSWAREHTTRGYLYCLVPASNQDSMLLFTDGDKDGTIDSFDELTYDQFFEQELHLVTSYTEMF